MSSSADPRHPPETAPPVAGQGPGHGGAILVAGATGTVGSALVATLADRGADVTALSSQPAATVATALDVPVRQADLRDPASLVRTMAGVDTLFLLLPLVPDKEALAANAIGAAKASGVRHIVRSSAIGADADSPVGIARMQGRIDAMVQASGLGWTLLRPSGFMQNYSTYGAGMIRAGTFVAAHGDGAQGLVDAGDIAACAAEVLRDPGAHAGAIYTPTGVRSWRHDQAMAVISAALGRDIRYLAVDDAAVRAALVEAAMPETVIDWLEELASVVRNGWAAEVSGDVRRLTGREPRAFEDFVQDHLDAWRD